MKTKPKDIFNNHNDWEFDEHTISNNKTGVVLWIANGASYFTGYNGTLHFGWLERRFMWYHFKKMCVRKALGLEK